MKGVGIGILLDIRVAVIGGHVLLQVEHPVVHVQHRVQIIHRVLTKLLPPEAQIGLRGIFPAFQHIHGGLDPVRVGRVVPLRQLIVSDHHIDGGFFLLRYALAAIKLGHSGRLLERDGQIVIEPDLFQPQKSRRGSVGSRAQAEGQRAAHQQTGDVAPQRRAAAKDDQYRRKAGNRHGHAVVAGQHRQQAVRCQQHPARFLPAESLRLRQKLHHQHAQQQHPHHVLRVLAQRGDPADIDGIDREKRQRQKLHPARCFSGVHQPQSIAQCQHQADRLEQHDCEVCPVHIAQLFAQQERAAVQKRPSGRKGVVLRRKAENHPNGHDHIQMNHARIFDRDLPAVSRQQHQKGKLEGMPVPESAEAAFFPGTAQPLRQHPNGIQKPQGHARKDQQAFEQLEAVLPD